MHPFLARRLASVCVYSILTAITSRGMPDVFTVMGEECYATPVGF